VNLRLKSRPVCDSRGFTLLEMIIALTLVAMMAVSLWGVFRISVRSWQNGTRSIDSNQRYRTVLDLVKKQLASVYGLTIQVDLQEGGIPYPLFAGTETSLQCVSLNSLRFQQNPGLVMVSYDVVRDRRGNYSLVEREERFWGLDPGRESFFVGQDQQSTVIFENLVSCMFEYFDPGSAERPPQWLRDWNARELGSLPAAVSLAMVALDARGERYTRHLVIPIPAKPSDPQLNFENPFENRPRRFRDDDPRNTK